MRNYPIEPLGNKIPIIGVITRRKNKVFSRNKQIFILERETDYRKGYKAVLTCLDSGKTFSKDKNCIYNVSKEWLDSLFEGDIICINPNGIINVLWEVNSVHNVILVTNSCNSQCVMCPQYLCADPKDLQRDNMSILRLLKKNSVQQIGLTGGEPTLYLDRCIEIIKKCKKRFPNATIVILTNGRTLNEGNLRSLLKKTRHSNLLFCIPLHADNSCIHDATTSRSGSFAETINSIQNLAIYYQKIELRIVITKLNYERLENISEFIYRNFPFCIHIAFMGMEVCELAYENREQVWVEPLEYIPNLCKAINHLNQRNMQVSMFNIPYCLLPQNYWKFAKDSISTWKKGYKNECNNCIKKDACPGLFLTSKIQSNDIKQL
jgi:His-Xaa-Ser system radical SAM maturase HxsC